jgi:hypothetical protein
VIREEGFLGCSIRCMSDVNVVGKRAGTILSDHINKYFLSFYVFLMASVRELNCQTVLSFYVFLMASVRELNCHTVFLFMCFLWLQFGNLIVTLFFFLCVSYGFSSGN